LKIESKSDADDHAELELHANPDNSDDLVIYIGIDNLAAGEKEEDTRHANVWLTYEDAMIVWSTLDILLRRRRKVS
jgi:hypothetical protein